MTPNRVDSAPPTNPSDEPAAHAHALLERLFELLHDGRALVAEAQPAGKAARIAVLGAGVNPRSAAAAPEATKIDGRGRSRYKPGTV